MSFSGFMRLFSGFLLIAFLISLLFIGGKELVVNGQNYTFPDEMEKERLQEYNTIRDRMNNTINQNDTFQERVFMLETFCHYSSLNKYVCVRNLNSEYLP